MVDTRWIVAGTSPASELADPIEKTLYTFIKNNWSPVGGVPAQASVTFSDTWWDGSGKYQIHVRPLTTTTPTSSVGIAGMRNYRANFAVHIFVSRGSGEWHTDPNVWLVVREVERILNLYGTQIAPGLYLGRIETYRDVPEETNIPEVYHRIIDVVVLYSMTAI